MCRLVLPLKIRWVNTPINLFLISIEIDLIDLVLWQQNTSSLPLSGGYWSGRGITSIYGCTWSNSNKS